MWVGNAIGRCLGFVGILLDAENLEHQMSRVPFSDSKMSDSISNMMGDSRGDDEWVHVE